MNHNECICTWAAAANCSRDEHTEPTWSAGVCQTGFLFLDGPLMHISGIFSKEDENYAQWSGAFDIMIGHTTVESHVIRADSLDSLREQTEAYIENIRTRFIAAFKKSNGL